MPKPTATTRLKKSNPDPHALRLRRLRDHLKSINAEAMFVSNPHDVAYLTGFLGGDSFLLVPPSKKPVLISDHRYLEDLQAFKHLATIVMRDGLMATTLGKQLEKLGFADKRRKPSLLIQGDHLTLQTVDGLKKHALRPFKVPARVLQPVNGLIAKFRAIKDEHEIKLITKAVRIQEAALEAVLPTLEPGMSELEIAAALEFEMKANGSTEPAFLPIVAVNANGSKPHYTPSAERLRKNKPLLIDWGATWQGYRSDMTRTVHFGRWSKPMATIYDIVHESHLAAVDAIKPGVRCADVDHAAREVIRKAGYGKHFGHGLGHGIGLNVHEAPSLGKLAGESVLQPGHVITVEPGIYLPGTGGVRLENDYLVTPRSVRNLCRLPMTREWATL